MASAWGALGTLLNVASMLLGGSGSRRQFVLSCDGEKVILPVTPKTYRVDDGQVNKVVNVEQLGEALIFGLPAARKVTFEGFFPNPEHGYPFVVGSDNDPAAMVDILTKWKEERKPVRLIITDSPVNLMTGIMHFKWREQDGSRDIYYQMELVEYIDLNTPPALNERKTEQGTGLKKRPSPSIRTDGAKKIRPGSDIVDVARKTYGEVNKWRRIVKNNGLKDYAITSVSKLRGLKIK